ncbi:hypothetical protein [uncultured Legionella sp.]|uniref:RCC1 domain-containing protein n=1 Tax=uncultured Legionella sp. TaxID=210934 RepID=UPI002619F0FF|nr:hypothetical protein [uncultured Legionella sp.]
MSSISFTTQATMPVWTFSAPNPKQASVSAGNTVTVQYTVTSQSQQAKKLIMPTTTGLSASPCYLEGKGSTCLLTLTINGSQMPANGFHEGPVLCEQGNPNQCYWPDSDNQLQVSRATAPATPGHLQLSQFGSPVTSLTLQTGDSGILTLTNTGGSAITALTIQLPFGWQSYFNNHCPTTLAPQQICTLSYTIPGVSATGIFNPLVVQATQADNTLTVPVSIQTIGAAYCWGENSLGQLGIGNNTNSNTPVQVSASALGHDVVAITGGSSQTCALKKTGDVYCWGENADGQLGNGNNTPSNTPVQVSASALGLNVVAITEGESHACALKQTGEVYCWGKNNSGQLGNGGNTSSNIPVSTTVFSALMLFQHNLSTSSCAIHPNP